MAFLFRNTLYSENNRNIHRISVLGILTDLNCNGQSLNRLAQLKRRNNPLIHVHLVASKADKAFTLHGSTEILEVSLDVLTGLLEFQNCVTQSCIIRDFFFFFFLRNFVKFMKNYFYGKFNNTSFHLKNRILNISRFCIHKTNLKPFKDHP